MIISGSYFTISDTVEDSSHFSNDDKDLILLEVPNQYSVSDEIKKFRIEDLSVSVYFSTHNIFFFKIVFSNSFYFQDVYSILNSRCKIVVSCYENLNKIDTRGRNEIASAVIQHILDTCPSQQ